MTLSENAPTVAEWRALVNAALRVKELAPWQWLYETQIFGVKNPEGGGLGFVSIMGNLGEHLSIAVYQGARALYQFLAIQQGAGPLPQLLLETPQLQASFEDREMLDLQDRQVFQRTGIKVRGRQAWPQFRSHRSAFFPWYIESDEARFLTVALEQVLDVTPRLKDDPGLLPDVNSKRFLVRVSEAQEDGALAWRDRVQTVQPPGGFNLRLPAGLKSGAQVKALPKGLDLEVHVFMLLEPIQDPPGTRPYFPYMLMIVDRKSGMVLGTERLRPYSDWKDVWQSVPYRFLKVLAAQEVGPRTIYVKDRNLATILKLYAEEAGYTLGMTNRLPMLEEAQASLMNFMGMQFPPDLR